MSHFYTLVLVNNTSKNLEEDIADLMAAYDESSDVDEYDDQCYCINSIASRDANRECEKKFGSFDLIRDDYWKKINAMIDVDIQMTEDHFKSREEAQKILKWEDHIATWTAYEKECVQNHPLFNKPNPDCETCNGTGLHKSTYNPKSKWDWYQVGGRWSGILDSYDPSTDQANVKTCDQCYGTGMRNDALGVQARQADPTYTCNGCQGKGSHAKWPTEWKQYTGDTQPVEKVIQAVKQDDDIFPYVLVTPDGQWHEKGEMGWFGISKNEKGQDDWNSQVLRMLTENPNTIAVVVDCHI